MIKRISIIMILFVFTASLSFAGGWDKSKGMDKVSLKGEIVCLGCTLKKMNGANAQCSLYSQHEMGFKSADGTLWSIVDNAKGHDITRAHQLLGHKQATITGWLYPLAHFIEIDNIDVEGVSKAKIEKAGWDEDQLISKRLSSRKVGEAPILAHEHK